MFLFSFFDLFFVQYFCKLGRELSWSSATVTKLLDLSVVSFLSILKSFYVRLCINLFSNSFTCTKPFSWLSFLFCFCSFLIPPTSFSSFFFLRLYDVLTSLNFSPALLDSSCLLKVIFNSSGTIFVSYYKPGQFTFFFLGVFEISDKIVICREPIFAFI